MSTEPSNTQDHSGFAAVVVEEAYQRFMYVKHGSEDSADHSFKYFDPNDDIPDHGLMFLKVEESFWLTPRSQLGPRRLVALFRTARRKPQVAGWYMSLSGGWIFVAETPEAATQMFERLIKQL